MNSWIVPDWPAPAGVKALVTTRVGGHSTGAYAGFNLGSHVGDAPAAVAANRIWLRQQAGLPADPVWLTQVHGKVCLDLSTCNDAAPEADASMTRVPGQVCAILTADCLPVVLCSDDGTTVGAAHAGWRGLLSGVIEATAKAMAQPGAHLMAWLGPAIGPSAFEVGAEVREAFMTEDAASGSAFTPRPEVDGKWLCDIYALARLRLARIGVHRVYGGDRCTYSESDHFFSYRREMQTGRMATLIWIDPAG
ncbi:MAG TPA: peptidoglycan editing factor PgeF [Rhodocyclaceae bacterium]|nr:peptidoglycan editing factor PgeF [Rhodocyclaceae bacterium]